MIYSIEHLLLVILIFLTKLFEYTELNWYVLKYLKLILHTLAHRRSFPEVNIRKIFWINLKFENVAKFREINFCEHAFFYNYDLTRSGRNILNLFLFFKVKFRGNFTCTRETTTYYELLIRNFDK